MKVRWTEGSVRFRIAPGELEALRRGESPGVALTLPDGTGWRALLRPDAATTALLFVDGTLRIDLTEADLARLCEPEAEGVYFQTGEENPLRYYVEKDFPCVHPGAPEARERPTETFAPPPGFKQRHTGGCG